MELGHQLSGAGAHAVAEDQGSDGIPIDSDEHPGSAGRHGDLDRFDADDSALGEPARAADRDSAPIHDARESLARVLDDLGRARERQPASLGGVDDGLGENVGGELVGRCRQPQDLICVEAGRAFDAAQRRGPSGDRPGLVEQHRAGAAHPLERAAVLDHDAGAGRARETGHNDHRRREDQRAGGGDHEHRERADGVAAADPGAAGEHHGDRQEAHRVAVGHPHERRAVGPRALDHPHDLPVRARRGVARDAHLERLAGRDAARAHRVPGPPGDRERLAGERGLVDDGGGVFDDAVHGHDVAGTHDHAIARGQRGDADLLDVLVAAAVGDPWCAVEQRGQIAPGSPARCCLQLVASGQHQRDHRAGELLAQRQRAGHRQQRDDVDPDVPVAQARRNRPGEWDEQDEHAGCPDVARGGVVSGERQNQARGHRRECPGGQEPRPLLGEIRAVVGIGRGNRIRRGRARRGRRRRRDGDGDHGHTSPSLVPALAASAHCRIPAAVHYGPRRRHARRSSSAPHTIARHEFAGLDHGLTPVPHHRRVRGEVGGERVDGAFGLLFLGEREPGVEHDDGEDRLAHDDDAAREGEQCRREQQEGEGVGELADELTEPPAALAPAQLVRPAAAGSTAGTAGVAAIATTLSTRAAAAIRSDPRPAAADYRCSSRRWPPR